MGFIVKLGVCKDPVNKISKTMSNVTEFQCTVKKSEGINVMTPVILLNTSDIVNYNYCYIPDFKRYYYIKSININNTGLWEVELNEDVLMSFKTGILASTAMLARSTTHRNYFLKDVSLPVTDKTLTWTREFPNSPFDGETHGAVVTIAGPHA